MSTSSIKERENQTSQEELDTVRTLSAVLKKYLLQLQTIKSSLRVTHTNLKTLEEINGELRAVMDSTDSTNG